MPFMRLLLTLLFLISLSVPLAAGPKAVKKSEPPKQPAIAMKEKALPPTGTQYVYLDKALPKYLLDALRNKGMQPAFLFDNAQGGWLREFIPTLKGTTPLLFVRGGFTQMDALRFKETLEFFDYNVTIVHLKMTPGDTLGALPVTNIMVIERKVEKERIFFTMTRGTREPENGMMRSVLDERDLADPLTVAEGIVFKGYGIRFVNIDEGAEAKLPATETTVIFSRSEPKLKAYIER
jgi:hypothetical protein